VLSNNTVITSLIAEIFFNKGKDEVLKLVEEWDKVNLEKYCESPKVCRQALTTFSEDLPQVERVYSTNLKRLIKESNRFRKTVRGEAIGELG
jgi:energy-converting hydrogenase A subunit R